MSKVPAPKSRLSRPARGLARKTQPMPQMNGGMAEGRVKALRNSARPARSVRNSRIDNGAPSTSATPAAPPEVTTVLKSAARASGEVRSASAPAPSESVPRAMSSTTGAMAKARTGNSAAAPPNRSSRVACALTARTPC